MMGKLRRRLRVLTSTIVTAFAATLLLLPQPGIPQSDAKKDAGPPFTGFHAPQEAARILGESIDFARQGQIALRDPTFKPTVPVLNIPPPPPAKP